MTNNFNASLCEIRRPRSSVRAAAKYILSLKDSRPLITFGGLIGAASLALPYLVAMLIASFLPQTYLYDNISAYTASIVILLITLALIPFTFSPIYFGIYRVLLKATKGESVRREDLFYAFTDRDTYLRSVVVFFHSFGIIYGMYVMTGFVQAMGLFASLLPNEYVQGLIWLAAESLIMIYILFGVIYTALMRKYKFLLIPMLIDRTDLSFRTCKKIVYASKREVYTDQLRFDLTKCFFWNLLSVFTVGILQIIFVGPDMISKKVALYSESVLWLNDNR